MGSSESKSEATPSSTKTEVNTSLIQLHWESFGLGAGSLIMIIVILGIMILLYFFLRIYCCQRRAVRTVSDMRIPQWTPMMNVGSVAQIPWVPSTPSVVTTPPPPEAPAVPPAQPSQLMLTDAMGRLLEERRNRLGQHF